MQSDQEFWKQVLLFLSAIVPNAISIIFGGIIGGIIEFSGLLSERIPSSMIGRLASRIPGPPYRTYITCSVIILSVLYATFEVYNDLSQKNYATQQALEALKMEANKKDEEVRRLSTPDITIESEHSMAMADDIAARGVVIVLMADVINRGAPAALIRTSWRFSIILPNGSVRFAYPSTQAHPDPACTAALLDKKSETPIQRNGYVSGILSFSAPNATQAELRQPNSVFVISVEDVYHRVYNARFPFTDYIQHEGQHAYGDFDLRQSCFTGQR